MKEQVSILEAVGGEATTNAAMERMILARELPKRTIGLVLAGGRGSRLMELTDRRAKPAVYFGGKFRIIDFVLSNCINSGIRRMGVLTQYKSHSLLRHLQRGWNFLRGGEYRRVTPAGLMFAPYRRLVALHLTIIFGAMAVTFTGAPVAAVAILVGVKTLIDLGLHLAEHRGVTTAGPVLTN